MNARGKSSAGGTLLLILLDTVMLATAFVLAYSLRLTGQEQQDLSGLARYLGFLGVQVGITLFVFFFSRLYHVVREMSRFDLFASIGGGVSIGVLLAVGVSQLLFRGSAFEVDLPRLMLVYIWILDIVLVTLGRLAHQVISTSLYRRGIGSQRVLILGTGEVGQMICQKIQGSPQLGYKVVGFADGAADGAPILGVPTVGSYEDLPALIERHKVDEVVIALTETSRGDIIRLISMCDRGSVGIKIFPDLFQLITAEVTVGDLAGLPLLTVRDIALRGWKLSLKRAMDVMGSAAALVMVSPCMVATALAIWLESPGPVFYVQERMGMDAKPFGILKFRSMRLDAEANGPGWTVENDPRVTRVGRIIRRFSIDEFPQFINVLLGDMSLVGPRPERPVYVEQFRQQIPRYMERHREKAGLTGWAQINGLRGDTSIAERTKYDLWYVEHWSFWLDIKILLRTAVRFFRDPNAY